MKSGSMRLLTIVGLVALLICSWYTLINTTKEENDQYASYLNAAREHAEQDLDDIALSYYNQTMEYRDSIELRDEIAQFYQENYSTRNYESFCELILEDYPYEAVGYERLTSLYKELGEYDAFYAMAENAEKRGIQSQTIEEMKSELTYYYELKDSSAVTVGTYSANYCAVQRGSGLWGYLGNNAKTALSFQYLKATPFSSSGYAIVQLQDERYAVINKSGTIQAFEREGRNIEACTGLVSGRFAVKYDGKYHYYDSSFNELFGAYDYAGGFNCGVAAVQNNGKWAIIDESGAQITQYIYDDVKLDDKGIAFRGDRALVKQNGKYILINVTGDRIGTGSWDDADAFNANMIAAVSQGGNWGFIDADGTVVFDYQYDGARSFSNGLAAVMVGAKWGYIESETGEMVIEAKFDEAGDFATKGNAFVRQDALWCMMRIYSKS